MPDPVLDYLQQSFVGNLDLETRYWATGEASLGGCSWCYPQPVDVETLESGFGVVPTSPPGRYQPGRPMGTPDWLPYPQNPKSGATISLSDIEQMSKDGVPEAQIIERINHSPLSAVIGVGGTSAIHTQPFAGLSGSRLALLHAQGVAYPVLDAVQGQFLAQFIETERLRYQNIASEIEPCNGATLEFRAGERDRAPRPRNLDWSRVAAGGVRQDNAGRAALLGSPL